MTDYPYAQFSGNTTYSQPSGYQPVRRLLSIAAMVLTSVKDFSVQGSSDSSLAHALSRSVTPVHSPDQVAQSNASTIPQPPPDVGQDVR